MDLRDDYNHAAFIRCLYQKRTFCVYLDPVSTETRVAPLADVPKGARITFTVKPADYGPNLGARAYCG